MEAVLIEIAKQVPALVVLVLLVRWFLHHLSERDKVLREIGDACHAESERREEVIAKLTEAIQTENARREGVLLRVIERNTASTDRNTEMLGRALERMGAA